MPDTQIATKRAILAIVAFALVTTPAHAGLTLFTGADDGAGSLATAPSSAAAAASFDAAVAALGTEHIITFESSPLGLFSSLAPASGVNLTGTNVNGNDQSIVNTTSNINITPPCTNGLCGYNTSAGGSNFLLLFGGTATFSFIGGTDAFGAYLSGVQNAGETITFSDGTSQSIDIPNPGFDGGTAFVDRKSTRLNSSHSQISYAVFCLKKKKKKKILYIFIKKKNKTKNIKQLK